MNTGMTTVAWPRHRERRGRTPCRCHGDGPAQIRTQLRMRDGARGHSWRRGRGTTGRHRNRRPVGTRALRRQHRSGKQRTSSVLALPFKAHLEAALGRVRVAHCAVRGVATQWVLLPLALSCCMLRSSTVGTGLLRNPRRGHRSRTACGNGALRALLAARALHCTNFTVGTSLLDPKPRCAVHSRHSKTRRATQNYEYKANTQNFNRASRSHRRVF